LYVQQLMASSQRSAQDTDFYECTIGESDVVDDTELDAVLANARPMEQEISDNEVAATWNDIRGTFELKDTIFEHRETQCPFQRYLCRFTGRC